MKKLIALFSFFSVCGFSQTFFSSKPQVSFVGDSRASLLLPGASTFGGVPMYEIAAWWPSIANDLSNKQMHFVYDYGISGYRSDQWVSQGATFNGGVLNDFSDTVVEGPGCVNDVTLVPFFSNTTGVYTTIGNVASQCSGNMIQLASAIVAKGKRVILIGDTGAQGMGTTSLGAILEANARLKTWCDSNVRCLYWDWTHVMWLASQTSTIQFKSGYTDDGTHPNSLASYYLAKEFAQLLSQGTTVFNQSPVCLCDNTTTSALNLLASNQINFNTLSGGYTAGLTVTSGTMPAGWNLIGNSVGTTVVITSAADANGYGNDVTFAFTMTAYDTINIQPQQGYSFVAGDKLQCGYNVSVASGATNVQIPYINFSIVGNNGAIVTGYDLYPNQTAASPTVAYSLVERTELLPLPLGATSISGLNANLVINSLGAGNMTVTISQPMLKRQPF